MISAKPHLISLNKETGTPIFTFIWRFPRFILPEVLTHRAFSRNSASSRAIPAKVLRKHADVMPSYFGENQKGMQAGEELTGWRRKHAELWWKSARFFAKLHHMWGEKIGIHKQIVNRVIEPFVWMEQIVTFTDFENFRRQRAHEDAEPHFQELARQTAYWVDLAMKWFSGGEVPEIVPWSSRISKFTQFWDTGHGYIQYLNPGEWHLPFYISQPKEHQLYGALITSSAKCARVSYLKHDGTNPNDSDNRGIHDKLVGSDPKHMSPTEHQAEAMRLRKKYGNFDTWRQYRWYLETADVALATYNHSKSVSKRLSPPPPDVMFGNIRRIERDVAIQEEERRAAQAA